MSRWTAADIPDLSGRRAIVTGANSGIGFHAALKLARHGADVTLAVRDRGRGESARTAMLAELDGVAGAGELELGSLDLAALSSVQEFAESQAAGARLDVLVNNAGIMATPRRETADGFEMQLGTNHLGHMALTLRLMPALMRTGAAHGTARVVTVSSGAHRFGKIALDDLMGERSYRAWGAYGQSKLANLLFAFELQRRLDTAHAPVASYAAHPGYAATNLQSVAPTMRGSGVGARMAEWGNTLLAQPAEMGALPTLYAATAPGLPPGAFVGPDGFMEQRGHPRLVTASATAYDESLAAAFWLRSEELIGLRWDDVVPGPTT
jgi:NAD(P)-dependent dehydrogenase (short-subunit alcohol dehydrogenase family)